MLIGIAVPVLIVYVVTLGFTLAHLRQRSEAEVAENGTRLAASFAARFDGCLREAAAVAETTARSLESGPFPEREHLFRRLRGNTEHTSFIYGACLAFEPGTYPAPPRLFAPYVCRDGSSLKQLIIDESVYDWTADPQYTWYRLPREKNRAFWSDPYFDEGAGNVLMSTYSAPIRREGRFAGVATVDIDLAMLRETIGKDIVGDLDYLILTRDGRFVYSHDPSQIMRDSLPALADRTGHHELARHLPRLLADAPGRIVLAAWDAPRREWLFHASIPSAPWTFVLRVPEELVLAGVRARTWIGLSAIAVTLLLILASIAFVATRIAGPVRRLTSKVAEISDGNLDVRIDESDSGDEVAELARAFNLMTSRLQTHIQRLAEEQAARARIERDLSIARDIQQSFLPRTPPELPGFELAAWSLPADQTGGDYYDWQVLPDGNVAISLADVTGHGIGPALVTAVCRAYARASFPATNDIGTALNRINDLLVEDLTEGRFVTFVVALLNVSSAQVRMLSAGHGPLFLYRAAEHRVHSFDAHNIPFGIAPRAGYDAPALLDLQPGDILALVTDGFLEWSNPRGDMFGADRFVQQLLADRDLPPAQLIQALYRAVQAHAAGRPQQDDLTAVVLKRLSPS